MGNIFSNLTGTGGIGLTGSEQSQTQHLDPITKALDAYRFTQLQSAGASGADPYNFYGLGSEGAYTLHPTTDSLINYGATLGQTPGLDPSTWYNQTLHSLDPSASISASQDILRRILQPELFNSYSTMGLARSGALQEAYAKAASGMALPIAQQQLQNIFATNQQYPNIDIALRQAALQRLGQGIQYSDMPRTLSQQNLERQTNAYISSLNATPYNPAVRTTGTKDTGPLTEVLGAVGGSGAGGGVAQAIGGGGRTAAVGA